VRTHLAEGSIIIMAKKAEQPTEIAVVEVLQPELLEVAKSSGVIITEAQAIGLRFAPFMKTVNEISLKIAELDPENVTEESAKIARRLRLDLVENRGTKGLETVHKELKQESLVKGRLIDNYRNIVLSSSEMSESIAEKIEKHQERVEAKRREELKTTRIDLLAPFETDTEFLPLDIMDEEKFQLLLAREKESFEAVKAKREQDEKDRIEAERKAEEARLAEIEAEKQRQAERDTENERLKKEAEIREAELAKERAEREKQIEAERKEAARIASEKQAEIDKANAEADRIRKELESKQLAEENERLAKIAEQEEKEAAAKALLKAPDQEKVKAFYVQFTALQFPELQSEAGKAMAVRVNEALAIVKQVIIQDSKTLL